MEEEIQARADRDGAEQPDCEERIHRDDAARSLARLTLHASELGTAHHTTPLAWRPQ